MYVSSIYLIIYLSLCFCFFATEISCGLCLREMLSSTAHVQSAVDPQEWPSGVNHHNST